MENLQSLYFLAVNDTAGVTTCRVFSSGYCREDTANAAGRLYDLLRARFGRRRVFMDVDTIEPGEVFADAIDRTVGSCNAFVAVIGPDWLGSKDARGLRRLDDEKDFVRLELASALKRNIHVIPRLVGGAGMPRRQRTLQRIPARHS